MLVTPSSDIKNLWTLNAVETAATENNMIPAKILMQKIDIIDVNKQIAGNKNSL